MLAGAPAAAAVPASEAIRLLNLQRQATGIPGDLVEDPYKTSGCRHHNNYMRLNGFDHGEDAGNPGYTEDGANPNGSEVLSHNDNWSERTSPWTGAPIHLYLMFDPVRTDAGYSFDYGYACMRLGGYRPEPAAPAFYAYPGNGLTGVPRSETASESPYTPQELVGIPEGQETGPNVLLFSQGFGSSLRAESASLTGPAGPVEIRMVEEDTKNSKGDGSWFAGGGVMIPVAPLEPFSVYNGEVRWRNGNGAVATQTFSFETRGRDNRVSVDLDQTDPGVTILAVQSDAPNPSAQITGPDGTFTPELDRNGRARLNLGPGSWQACATSGSRESGYEVAQGCASIDVKAVVRLTLKKARAGARKVTLLAGPDAALGRTATVRATRFYCGRHSCRRTRSKRKIALAASQLIRLPSHRRGDRITVIVSASGFTVGGVPYESARVERTYR